MPDLDLERIIADLQRRRAELDRMQWPKHDRERDVTDPAPERREPADTPGQ